MPNPDAKSMIVDSATKFFSRFGFHKTTMDEIARNIHKAKGLLYYYFRSKEELFNEVLKKELYAIKSELISIIHRDEDALLMIRDYFLTRMRLLNGAVNYHETLKADFFEKYHFVKDVRDDFEKFERQQLKLILDKGEKEGFVNVKSIHSVVDVILIVMTGIEIPLFLQNRYVEVEDTIEEIATMIVNSIRYQNR